MTQANDLPVKYETRVELIDAPDDDAVKEKFEEHIEESKANQEKQIEVNFYVVAFIEKKWRLYEMVTNEKLVWYLISEIEPLKDCYDQFMKEKSFQQLAWRDQSTIRNTVKFYLEESSLDSRIQTEEFTLTLNSARARPQLSIRPRRNSLIPHKLSQSELPLLSPGTPPGQTEKLTGRGALRSPSPLLASSTPRKGSQGSPDATSPKGGSGRKRSLSITGDREHHSASAVDNPAVKKDSPVPVRKASDGEQKPPAAVPPISGHTRKSSLTVTKADSPRDPPPL